MPKDGGGHNGLPSLFLWIPSSFPLIFFFCSIFSPDRRSCVSQTIITGSISQQLFFSLFFSPPLQPLVCSLCAAFSYLFNLLPIVSLFCLHRSLRPSCRGMALLSYNLDNAGCCLCSSFFFFFRPWKCVCLSHFEGQVQGWRVGGGAWRSTNLLPHMGPTSRGREDEQKSRKNQIKYVFVEHDSKWSRNNLIGSAKMCLDFSRTSNLTRRKRRIGRGENICLVSMGGMRY